MEKNKRIIELMNALDSSSEIIKEQEKNTDENVLNEEYERLKNLSSGNANEDFHEKRMNENFYMSGSYNTGGRGQTVNTMMKDYMGSSTAGKMPKPEAQSLQPSEALMVCIFRTLKSGAPINNVGFYDEVNWNLMNLGFPAKNEVDIKNALLEIASSK